MCQGFQKALTLLFPSAFPADANVSTAVERFREAGDVNCEEFVAMYLEAQGANLWTTYGLKRDLARTALVMEIGAALCLISGCYVFSPLINGWFARFPKWRV